MGSRKEEERNEKIIRGLMKLPPNRRCINCNSVGPQYVCPNFWTFVCTTCSGIHREFTHRVKSVSMSKFTSQEVEALQNGGNQRAREIYLKDWDLQRQRLPDSSKVDKIHEFIRSVYVDRQYAGGRASEKPPRDLQNHRIREDETRRASSYHSYSQSPPYDYQYEDRRYGKQAAALTRKPGSDRGRYEGKLSSFGYSAGRLSEQMYEDRFENDGSGSRVSDYSVSSGGDASRSGVQSPNFQKDIGSSSPSFQPSQDTINEVRCQAKSTVLEANVNRDAEVMPFSQRNLRNQQFRSVTLPSGRKCRGEEFKMNQVNELSQYPTLCLQEDLDVCGIAQEFEAHTSTISAPKRTVSSGSFGSVDSYSMSVKSFNSGGLTDAVSEPDQYAGTLQDKPTSLSSLFGSSDRLDLFKSPVQPEEISSAASSIDLFQLPAASSSLSINSFQPSVLSSAASLNVHQPPQALTLSLELFADFPQHQSTTKQVQESVPKNEGWATFDTHQPSTSISETENIIPANIASNDGGSIGNFDLFSSSNPGMQWPSFANISNPWSDNLQDFTAPNTTESAQLWNAFEDSIRHFPVEGTKKSSESVGTDKLLSAGDQYMGVRISEQSSKDGIQRAASEGEPHDPSLPLHVLGPPYTPQVLPQMGEIKSHATDHRSNNPFDVPYDIDLEQTNMFLDMSSLQASLPNAPLQSSFLSDISQPWFPQNAATVMPYIPAAVEGGLTYLAGQAQSTQIPNVSTQGPVASMGGNPFA